MIAVFYPLAPREVSAGFGEGIGYGLVWLLLGFTTTVSFLTTV